MSFQEEDFFGKISLEGYKYYYYLPNLDWKRKAELSTKIQSKKGVNYSITSQKNTISLSTDSVVIIENDRAFQTKSFKNLIAEFGHIGLYTNEHIEEYYINSRTEKLKIIVIDDLYRTLEMYTNNDIKLHINNGLPDTIDEKGLISICFCIKGRKTVVFHQFNQIYIDHKTKEYDIPYYDNSVPKGFSVFCSSYEKEKIIEHEKKKKKIIDTEELEKKREKEKQKFEECTDFTVR